MVFDAATIGRGEDEEGVARVLYVARIFQRGSNVSFVERAEFLRDGGGMRYVRDAIGVHTVVVNGEVAWADGAYTDSASGAVCALN